MAAFCLTPASLYKFTAFRRVHQIGGGSVHSEVVEVTIFSNISMLTLHSLTLAVKYLFDIHSKSLTSS
jgi:hypothetical protein